MTPLLIEFTAPISGPFPAALLELDLDPAAERYVIADRRDFSAIWIGSVPPTNPAKLVVPIEYATSNNLLVMIFDDAGSPSYNMVGNDKVQAQLVDARTITTNP